MKLSIPLLLLSLSSCCDPSSMLPTEKGRSEDPKPPANLRFTKEKPPLESREGVDACAYLGGVGSACLEAYLAEKDPVKKRFMRRLSDADAFEALAQEKKGEVGGPPHAELALSCKISETCGQKNDEGDPGDDGYHCLTKAEAARADSNTVGMNQAHAFACKCGAQRATLPIMGGYLACDGNQPVKRGTNLDTQEAKDIRDCATCDPIAGYQACQKEKARLEKTDPQLAKYLQNTHIPQCLAQDDSRSP